MSNDKTRQELIEEELHKNVDLSTEEYREKVIDNGDTATAGHGEVKKAPVTEAVRFKRIQTNYMSMHINYLAVMLSYFETINHNLEINNALLAQAIKRETTSEKEDKKEK